MGARTLRRALVRRVVGASVVASVAFVGYYQLLGPLPDNETRLGSVARNVFFSVVGSSALALVTDRYIRRRFEPEWRWLAEGRPPDGSERSAVVRQPARLAAFVVLSWQGAIAFAIADDLVAGTYRYAMAELVGIELGTLANASLVYLLAERVLRPVFAPALAAGASAAATAGVRPRFLLAWALGSALPLVGIVITPALHQPGDAFPATAPMIYLACLGLAIGALMTRVTAGSVADPVASVRRALLQVQSGDLDAAVSVDDAGEIGLLQSGFNDMVAGLRERRQLEDLFGRHVGADVARRAVEEGTSLGGELVSVSVLFVDLIGSSRLAERVSATEVVAVVNRFLAQVVEAATNQGGWVNKFEGDGALCIFGAPVHQADHASRALRAASDLQSRLQAMGVDAGIGVSSGEVVAGNVGAEHRYEYTVIGRPVNEAARLTDLAKLRPGRLLASAAAVAQSGLEGWSDAGTVELRGIREPVAVCEPTPTTVS